VVEEQEEEKDEDKGTTRGSHGLPKAGVHNLLLTASYFSIFQLMRLYQSKYETVFTASTVL
jgi:hypothetical protein